MLESQLLKSILEKQGSTLQPTAGTGDEKRSCAV